MKKLTLIAAMMLLFASAFAQKPNIKWPDYQFTTDVENPITSVKNQHRSGTCWAFSTIAFVESEVIRINNIKDEADYPDFSEMFVVYKSYLERAEKFIRVDGALGFSAGSEADDVLHVIEDYGLVPQEVYSGMNYGTELPEQGELDAALKGYVSAIAKNPNRKLTPSWKSGVEAVLKAYLGEIPEEFEYKGKKYTPASYRDALKFKTEDYVSLTSFTHHPFYRPFAIEVSDNWRWDEAYNVPIDEFMKVLDNAIRAGYTAAWGADVSEKGFKWRKGYALLVKEKDENDLSGTDRERWEQLSDKDREEEKWEIKGPCPELDVTQESRQLGFDNKETTDDHGMVIVGKAVDQEGNKYYKVQNSWDTNQLYHGFFYVSEKYFLAKTMNIYLNKEAIPAAIAAKFKK